MKNFLLFAILMCLPFALLAQQPRYSRVKIYTGNKPVAELFASGIDFTAADQERKWFMAEISEPQIKKLEAAGFSCEVLIDDLTQYYTSRFKETVPLTANDILLNETWPQPANFSLGSCGGFSTIDEMIAQLDLMRELYPELITAKIALSDTINTIEGRTVYYLRLSDNPDVNETEPEVLYTGMHHAREPIGMQHLLYYMWYLLENYASNQEIKNLVDNTEMYFVPVFNVDGYQFNIDTHPAGGGLWRKNRRNNGNNEYGIDINRNYGYKWGFDDTGSSPDPGSDTYRGTEAFSEPETRMMKYFCESHNFYIALNYHSYADNLLSPWGWTEETCVDSTAFDAFANEITRENGYIYGPGSTTIYPTNGGSDDWMYGEQDTKAAIFSYTPEVGSSNDGFWPSQQRILPLIQKNMFASITAARLTGNYGIVADESELFIWEQQGYLPFSVKRLGLQQGDFTVSVIPLGDAFSSVGSSKTFSGLQMLAKNNDSIFYELSSSLHVGDTIQYVLHLNNGYNTEYDTVTRIFGFPVTVFEDTFNTITNWTGSWGLSGKKYFSPSKCMADSPLGNYAGSATKNMVTKNGIPLPEVLKLVLEYRATWSMEEDYDYVQTGISVDNGTTWIPLKGKYTVSGSSSQLPGQPLYEGMEGEWVRETISLDAYKGKTVKFRFRFRSDQGKEYDGFNVDDFKISMLLDPTSLTENTGALEMLTEPFPNPSSGLSKISYHLPENNHTAQLLVFSAQGKEVMRSTLRQPTGTAEINTSSLGAGMYYVRIVTSSGETAVKKLIVQ